MRRLLIALPILFAVVPVHAQIGETAWGRGYVTLIGPLDPTQPILTIDAGSSRTFRVQCYHDDTTDTVGEWFLDGVKQESRPPTDWELGRSFEIQLGPDELYPIRRELRFLATDRKPKLIFTQDGMKELKPPPNQHTWILLVRPTGQLPRLREIRSSFLE